MKFTCSVAVSLVCMGLFLATAAPAVADQPITVLVNPATGTCTPDTVVVTQKHGKDVAIFFEIDPAAGDHWSWSSEPDPIVVEAPSGIFSDGKNPGGNGKGKVKLKNRNAPSDIGTYKYTATLIQAGSSTPVVIDPSIENKLD